MNSHIRDLIDRLSRINAADEWDKDINPTQWTALSYIAKANRFSRAPSQVAEFMAATRGTVSQTLKALSRKGLIEKMHIETDRRWISYTITPSGMRILNKFTAIDGALAEMDDESADSLTKELENLARIVLKRNGKRAFGICRACKYHQPQHDGGFCSLLQEKLLEHETELLCFEHTEAA